jgi:2-C-methyl-D-erythritol 2,4-cyclodiphosphate synthase
MFRIGFGSDIHRLTAGKPLIIGGVQVDSDLGCDGHSDADVLTHAITDALLGALSLGDIGSHFPDTDERWKNAESFVFLRFAVGLIKQQGYTVNNVDATVHLQKPKIRSYIEQMQTGLADALEVHVDAVSIKAKTGESVDSVGELRSIRAEAIVLLTRGNS